MKTTIGQISYTSDQKAFKAAVNKRLADLGGNDDELYDKLYGWDDLTESLTGKNLNSTAGTANYDFANAWVRLERSGDIAVDADCVMANFQTRHRMLAGEPLRFHLHWLQTNATSRTLTGKYRILQNGATAGAWVDWSATCTFNPGQNVFAYTSGTFCQITDLFDLDTTGWGLSTLVQVRFTRSDSNASADIYCIYADAHYKTDQPAGSTSEYIK